MCLILKGEVTSGQVDYFSKAPVEELNSWN